MLKLLFTLAVFLAFTAGSASADVSPDITPGKHILGLKAKSKEAEFRQLLGEPTSVINMGADRHGLLYGQNTMLIFWKDRLWEARTWQVKGWTPELFHEWLQYVPARKSGFKDFTVSGKFRIGQRRGDIEKDIKGMSGDSDEFSIVVIKGDVQTWFGFEYDENDTGELKDVNKQKLVSLAVRFPGPKK